MEWPKILPFDILYTSEFDIRVLYSIHVRESTGKPISYNSVTCTEGLTQEVPESLEQLFEAERLNMIIQIPELGAVAIGNQIGRVMLLTMTMSREFGGGFRVDGLLPFKSQEEKGLRPEVPLLGMAVGPIQGRETMDQSNSRFDPPDDPSAEERKPLATPRRHRLFLFYTDHTILSYEITRLPAADDMGVQHRTLLF